MKIYFLLFFLIFVSCKYNSNSIKDINSYNKMDKEYILSKDINYELEKNFNNLVEESFLKVYEENKNLKDEDIKFIYKIIPQGVIYPYSKISLECIVNTTNKNKFKDICNDFFYKIDKKYEKLRSMDETL